MSYVFGPPRDQLFAEIGPYVRAVVFFDLLNLGLFDPLHEIMNMHLWEVSRGLLAPVQAGVDESVLGAVGRSQNAICVDDLTANRQFAPGLRWLLELEIRSYYVTPLTSGKSKLGALGIGSRLQRAFAEADFQFLNHLAEMVALSVDTSLTDAGVAEEVGKLRLLFDIAVSTSAGADWDACIASMLALIQKWAGQDLVGLYVYEDDSQSLHLLMSDRDWAEKMAPDGRTPLQDTLAGQAFRTGRSMTLDRGSLAGLPFASINRGLELGVRSLCLCPLVSANQVLGVLKMVRRRDVAFSTREVEFFEQIAATVTAVLDRLPTGSEVKSVQPVTKPTRNEMSIVAPTVNGSKPAQSAPDPDFRADPAKGTIPFTLPKSIVGVGRIINRLLQRFQGRILHFGY